MKRHRTNAKLLRERLANTVRIRDFPIAIRVKPTSHEQYCFLCRQPIIKGEKELVIESGLWHGWLNKENKEANSHFRAVWLGRPRYIHSGSYRSIYVTRHIYLHGQCFGCLMKLMVDEAKLGFQIDAGCERCDKRFNCLTGNIGLFEIEHNQPYIPSHPCADRREKDE